MGTTTTVSENQTTEPTTSERAFGDVWAELERRHAWRIEEADIHNPPIALTRLPFSYQDLDNRHAIAFRERHRLDELIEGAADDWEAILRLRHWAFTHVTNGDPSFSTDDPVAIVGSSLAGASYYCTHFAYAFVAAATSVGFPARHLGIDCEHSADEGSTHHGVADVWVNCLRKWVALDPNYDSHMELEGVPLNAEELCKRWQADKGEGVSSHIGPDSRKVDRARTGVPGHHESRTYFWHYIDAQNDVFHRRNKHWPTPVIFLVDEERKRQTWYQGQPPNSYKHGRYGNGTFLTTERVEDAYPDLNCTRLALEKPTKMPYFCRVKFASTCVPNFSHYEGRLDGGEPFRIDGVEYPWRVHSGRCRLQVQAVNTAGRKGPASHIDIEIQDDPLCKPEWP